MMFTNSGFAGVGNLHGHYCRVGRSGESRHKYLVTNEEEIRSMQPSKPSYKSLVVYIVYK